MMVVEKGLRSGSKLKIYEIIKIFLPTRHTLGHTLGHTAMTARPNASAAGEPAVVSVSGQERRFESQTKV